MKFNLVTDFTISYSPSAIQLINSDKKLFIIGTWELIDKTSERDKNELIAKNYRVGSLILFEEKILHELECLDGGVFDIKVICNHYDYDLALTTHGNGIFAIYQIQNNQIQLKQKIVTPCSMLTTLATINLTKSKNITFIGDDCTNLLQIENFEIQSKLKLSLIDYPIWCIELRQLQDEELIILTGSDDGKLRFLKSKNAQKLSLISTHDIASAGVTSIAFASCDVFLNCKFINDDILIGSYDEHISIFHLVYDNFNSFPIQLTPKKSIHIPESGVWKMIRVKINPEWASFLIAAMYSMAHILDKDDIIYSFQQLNDEDHHSSHLVYGASADENLNVVLLSSFYAKKLYYFKKEIHVSE